MITTSRIKRNQGDFSLYSTYGWHPRAVAVALAKLAYLTRHGEYFLAPLSQMKFKGKATIDR